jgi:arginase family enzyme
VNIDVKTSVVCFPFDAFGSAGTGAGAELLTDELREILADNRRETVATRASAYQDRVRIHECNFDTPLAYQDWRATGRAVAQAAWQRGDFLLWLAGNHLGVLPLYDELSESAAQTVVIQFDAHLDIHHFSTCRSEPSHGNFLMHCTGKLPRVVNLGQRELLLPAEHVNRHFERTFAAMELAVDPEPALQFVRQACRKARQVFIDIDCDVIDPAFFPAVTQPVPFGLTPALFLRLLDAVPAEKVIGLALSEFDPARDDHDRSLATLMWLIEYLLLRRYE